MKFRFEQTVNAPRDAVYGFHENPANLAVLLEGWPSSRIVSHDGHIRPGAEMIIQQTILGMIPLRMRFRHIIHEPPHRFGEEMIQGPFRKFLHIHEFETAGDGKSTLIRDQVTIELPWFLGGEIAMRAFGRFAIRRFFEFRRRSLERLARSGGLNGLLEAQG